MFRLTSEPFYLETQTFHVSLAAPIQSGLQWDLQKRSKFDYFELLVSQQKLRIVNKQQIP